MTLFSKYKVMLNLKRLTTKELIELSSMLNAELKQRNTCVNNQKSMLEHGSLKLKDIFKTLFPPKKRKSKKCR